MELPDFASGPAEADRPATSDIRRINPIGCPGWNALIAAGSDSSFFHTEEWAQVLADTYGYEPIYIVSGGPKRIDSCLPLMEVDSWLTGRRGVGLPFTDYCEPIDRGVERLKNCFGVLWNLEKTGVGNIWNLGEDVNCWAGFRPRFHFMGIIWI